MQEQTESFTEYRARSGVNWSALKHYAKSPAHYLAAQANPPAQTPEMQTGSALHALVLEGEAAFARRYAIAPEGDKRRKEVKEAWAAFEAEHAGKEALTPAQNETVRRMAASLLEHPKVTPLLRRCTAREVSLQWTDPCTGIPCKGRLDGLDRDSGLVLDLKSARDASPATFARQAVNLQYHGQAAFYLNGLAAEGLSADFIFVVVESAPPFGVALYHVGPEVLARGRQLVNQYLEQHAACTAANQWPGYPADVQALILPGWA